MSDKDSIISFKAADIVNGEATVIYGLDMDVYPGDFVYIVGKVGTGKTSIIRTIIAENPLYKGSGKACGFELAGIKDKDIPHLRRKMGVVFQDFQLLMDRTVEDNLLFVLKATGWKDEESMSKRIMEGRRNGTQGPQDASPALWRRAAENRHCTFASQRP